MNYKKMNADELIHLISNQALNKDVKESHKLIIQDCCKELFKKKETIKKYKKITFVDSRVFWDGEEEEMCCRTKVKTRIVEIVSEASEEGFPQKLHHSVLERDDKYIVFHNSECHDRTFTILEVKDI